MYAARLQAEFENGMESPGAVLVCDAREENVVLPYLFSSLDTAQQFLRDMIASDVNLYRGMPLSELRNLVRAWDAKDVVRIA